MTGEKDPGASSTTTTTIPPKYSRYRSVRRVANAEPEPPFSLEVKPVEDGVTRSMSRYRRSRIAPKIGPLVGGLPVPAMPQIPRTIHSQSVNAESRTRDFGRDVTRRVTEPVQRPQHRAGEPRRQSETESERARRKAKEAQLKEEQERIAAQQIVAAEEQKAREAEQESFRMLADQKRKDLQRLEAELEAASSIQRVSSPRDKLKFFSRKRGLTKTTSPPTSTCGSASGMDPASSARARTRSNEPPSGNGPPRISEQPKILEEQSTRKVERALGPSKGIEQGGGGIVPQTDAPISASNAGERRVLIRCKQSSINLPINPETTPVELIFSAANIMTQNISTSTAILLESYTQLGLERRVRRYEHVRDIMNSWDRDTQNALILQNSDSPNYDTDLEVSSVPKEAPTDVTVHLYHSQKPGKWNKRYVTLLSTGQIFISRKPGAKMSDKDVSNICHLSDFDIYTPTPLQIRKNLKPPKKYCHAIKSQQKTTMFLSTENFVHFFCIDDESLSEKWYDAVQQWRSWYLVNRMGEGRRAAAGKTKKITTEMPLRPGTKAGHSIKVSVDESPYTIGSFQPLLNLERFGSPSQDPANNPEENRPRQIPFHLRNSVSMTLPSRRESKRHPPPVSYKLLPEAEGEFASSSLLGRTYSQRQKMQKEKELESKGISGPFVEGPSLLNGPTHQRTMSMKSAQTKRPETSAGNGNTGGLQWVNSQRQKPRPLLDFTPTFREAPQWDKTGKGHGVKAVDGVPLVEVATGPDVAGIPGLPQTMFRREGGGGGMQRPATAAVRKEREEEGAFLKGGLVSGF